jgi:hypothetical protein
MADYHISPFDLRRYHCDAIRGPELAMVEEHLLWCQECIDRAEEDIQGIRMNDQELPWHPSPVELEGYHLGRLSFPAVALIEDHIAGCQACADRSLALWRFVRLLRAGVVKGGFDVELLAREYRPKPVILSRRFSK